MNDRAPTSQYARKTAVATALALTGFAANSVLCRKALGSHSIDAWFFTCIRLLSGALTLFVLVRIQAARSVPEATARWSRKRKHGSWTSALALFAYAATFSLAYLRLSTGVGALALFACVQATMIGWGIKRGERPSPIEWLGIAVALAGLVLLTLPGAVAPDPIGLALMMVAGIAWGAYSLRGRASRSPLRSTAGNFARSVPMAVIGALIGASAGLISAGSPCPDIHLTANGMCLAVASGAVASGLGYSLWYAALPGLRAAHAAVLQLLVPILAATFGIVLLGESLSPRLLGSGAMILGGVGLAVLSKRRSAPAAASNVAMESGETSTPR